VVDKGDVLLRQAFCSLANFVTRVGVQWHMGYAVEKKEVLEFDKIIINRVVVLSSYRRKNISGNADLLFRNKNSRFPFKSLS
jgi:hypothetical protein